MKQLLKYFALSLFILGSLAAYAERRSVVIVADLEHGLALVPDGVSIPADVTVYAGKKPLVFTNAPESRFTAARQTIERVEAETSQTPFVVRDRNTTQPRAASDRLFHIATDDTDITYYVYYVDGSYHAVRKIVWDVSPYGTQYGAISSVYTPAGDYYSGSLYADQSSDSTVYYGFNQTISCSINGSGGLCSMPTGVYQTSDPFSANVTSFGRVIHRYPPICGRYGEPPCTETFSSTINITLP